MTEFTSVTGASGVGVVGELADDAQRLVEAAVDRDDPGAGDLRLEQLAGGDPAARQDDHDLEARRGRRTRPPTPTCCRSRRR